MGDTPLEPNHAVAEEEINKLLRKQKFFGTTIEVVSEEIHKLLKEQKARKDMENACNAWIRWKRIIAFKCELRSIQDRSKWVWTLSQSELRSISDRSNLDRS